MLTKFRDSLSLVPPDDESKTDFVKLTTTELLKKLLKNRPKKKVRSDLSQPFRLGDSSVSHNPYKTIDVTDRTDSTSRDFHVYAVKNVHMDTRNEQKPPPPSYKDSMLSKLLDNNDDLPILDDGTMDFLLQEAERNLCLSSPESEQFSEIFSDQPSEQFSEFTVSNFLVSTPSVQSSSSTPVDSDESSVEYTQLQPISGSISDFFNPTGKIERGTSVESGYQTDGINLRSPEESNGDKSRLVNNSDDKNGEEEDFEDDDGDDEMIMVPTSKSTFYFKITFTFTYIFKCSAYIF